MVDQPHSQRKRILRVSVCFPLAAGGGAWQTGDMETIRVFSPAEMPAAVAGAPRPGAAGYYAFYSSLWDGIVTDPAWMLVPADDHVAHRGDGVFETLKCLDGAIYALEPHLDRLAGSAAGIGLSLPGGRDGVTARLLATLRAGGRRDALARIIVARGPGGFGVAPSECPAPALYIAIYALPPPFMRRRPEGARAVSVEVPLKPGFLANLKTCNYLPNALMKQAATAAGADFPLAFDERGCLAEGATENAGIVTRDGFLRVPKLSRILDGITQQRVLALAPEAVRAGALRGIERGDISRAEVEAAAELLIFGTTPDVTAVTLYNGDPVGNGHPGPAQAALAALLEADQRSNPALRTPVFA